MASSSNEEKQLAAQYQSKTEKEHILHAPDTYIGSIDKVLQEMDIWDEKTERIHKKMVEFVPGLYKLFDEGVVNARDHAIRMQTKINENKTEEKEKDKEIKPVTQIQITVSEETGLITIENDGNGIDVAKHPETGLWIPEMIFGHLRTSTNYNTEEKKIVGGKNGFGFKLVLIWSKFGEVETVDHIRQLRYRQTFRDNLNQIDAPSVTKTTKATKPYTRVTFLPDYARLGIVTGDRVWKSFFLLLHKRAIDIAACTDTKVKVLFNQKAIPIKNFQHYWELYMQPQDAESEDGENKATGAAKRAYESPHPRWEYAVTLSPTHEFRQVSFVNGICTFKGGRHVDYIVNQIVKQIADTIEKKKKVKVSQQSIKEQIMIFLRCDIENPAFDSQTKENMTTPVAKFGSACEVSPAFIKKVMDMGVAETACAVSEVRENRSAAKKANGSKTKTIRGIANFSDANYAGGPKSGECTLILCEGLSAMAGIVSGLTKDDQNTYGIYPLKGKLLNVRDMPLKRITENKEIADIIKILGLEIGKKYSKEDLNRLLRYGKVMIMCDQDVDGSHIKGLCLNLFQSHWRSLFCHTGFLSFMNTPILRATRRQETRIFYNQVQYEQWKQSMTPNQLAGWTIKYFKGLGTSTAKEFKEYFANKKVIGYGYSGSNSDEAIDMMFNKKRADDRKTLLENYDKHLFLDKNHPVVNYEDFVKKELLHFSSYDCERSIPNMVDGLKTSNRKVLYACFKRGLTRNEIKVAQLSGYVSEHTLYHHGEASLNGAIVAMAQNFVGSNNIHLLEPNGQFGSRLSGGEDSASERYIFTLLNPLTRLLFPHADDAILQYMDEDGVLVEPEYYVPILPLILVNGSTGIGTGFSCHVPSFSPKQLVRRLRRFLKGEVQDSSEEFVPYYEGFLGTVEPVEKGATGKKYLIKGRYVKTGKVDQIRITELPVGTWTLAYKTFLEGLCDTAAVDKDGKKVAPLLRDVVSHSTDTLVDFTIDLLPGKLAEWESTQASPGINLLEKTLKLTTTVSTSNMHLFDEKRRLRKYETVDEIIEAYMPVRLDLYQKRKDALLKDGEHRLKVLRNKAKFIQELLDEVIDLRKMPNAAVVELLQKRGYDMLMATASETSVSYHYLTKMPMDSVSLENFDDLSKELAKTVKEMAQLRAKTTKQMWLEELDQFEKVYDMRYGRK